VTRNSTHTESTVVFPLQNGYANAQQCYVIRTLLFPLHTKILYKFTCTEHKTPDTVTITGSSRSVGPQYEPNSRHPSGE